MTPLYASEVHSILVKLLQTISIAMEKQNVGVEMDLKYGHRGDGTVLHFTVTDCLIPGREVSDTVTIPTFIQSGDEFDTVKAELERIAKFTGSLARGSLTGERQKLLDRRKELLSSLSEEDKYVLGLV